VLEPVHESCRGLTGDVLVTLLSVNEAHEVVLLLFNIAPKLD